jgi:hypothetical protein
MKCKRLKGGKLDIFCRYLKHNEPTGSSCEEKRGAEPKCCRSVCGAGEITPVSTHNPRFEYRDLTWTVLGKMRK